MEKLNSKELEVLKGIKLAHNNAGGDFTYAEEIKVDLTVNQVKGYISQLQNKGYIVVCDEYRQINFLAKSLEVFPDLAETCSVY